MARSMDVSSHIRKLLEEKQHHTEALNRINETLDQITSLLGRSGTRRGPGRPAKAGLIRWRR
jgi:hypothetical protein